MGILQESKFHHLYSSGCNPFTSSYQKTVVLLLCRRQQKSCKTTYYPQNKKTWYPFQSILTVCLEPWGVVGQTHTQGKVTIASFMWMHGGHHFKHERKHTLNEMSFTDRVLNLHQPSMEWEYVYHFVKLVRVEFLCVYKAIREISKAQELHLWSLIIFKHALHWLQKCKDKILLSVKCAKHDIPLLINTYHLFGTTMCCSSDAQSRKSNNFKHDRKHTLNEMSLTDRVAPG